MVVMMGLMEVEVAIKQEQEQAGLGNIFSVASCGGYGDRGLMAVAVEIDKCGDKVNTNKRC